MKRLRGTKLDPFGRAEVRRVERALPGEYSALMERALQRLTPATHETVARIADLPDIVRGYEDIKLANVARFREEAARLEAELGDEARGGGFTLPVVNA
jgi:indolepyruvate ferredoxin oxidoreductase